MMIVIMILFFILCFSILLFSLAFISAKRRNAVYWSDIGSPILVVLFWFAIRSIGYGHHKLNLDHLIEVPTALIFTLIIFYIRVVVADKPVNPTTSSATTVPRVVVALKPVKLNTADSTDPQPF